MPTHANLNKAATKKSSQQIIEFEDNRLLPAVFGQHDCNLARIEQQLGVVLVNKGNRVAIEGSEVARNLARHVLVDLYDMARRGEPIENGVVDGAIRMVEGSGQPQAKAVYADRVEKRPTQDVGNQLKITTRNRVITPRSPNQADYMRNMMTKDMVFGVGPAGTGKTYLAVAMAVAAMLTGQVERIVLSRPAVEAGENLGFLPGDLREKIDPYLRPLYDALYDMMPAEQVEKRIASNQIEIAPLAYMRGRTLADAYVILDEAQNTTVMQMKMLLTRFGENSRMVICGDPSQVDLPGGTRSGLNHALDILTDVEGIGVTRFTSKDVVRHPLVARIIDAYDEDTIHRGRPES